jgi:hypothetical protein
MEAEKTTLREELSFQRSESTIVLLQATIFFMIEKIIFCEFNRPENSGPNAFNELFNH